MIGKIIWILIAVLLGIIVLAAGIALVVTIIKMLFFKNVWTNWTGVFLICGFQDSADWCRRLLDYCTTQEVGIRK